MPIENVKKFAVIGAGGMGSGITELLSRIGKYQVVMVDTTEELVQRGYNLQKGNLQKFYVDKGKLTAQEAADIIGRIKTSTSIAEAVKDVDMVIEAFFENLELKKNVFKQLDAAAPAHCLLATNTSYQSVTEITGVTKRPEKCGGIHFFNPPAVMKLVEVVQAALTAPDTAKTFFDLAVKLGKEPVYARDTYGFIANRAYMGWNDTVDLLWTHCATPEDIDKAMMLGYNHPVGPCKLGDMIGQWGLSVYAENDAIKEYGWDRGHVHPMVKLMVRAGYVGGPGKKGIYDFYKDVISKS